MKDYKKILEGIVDIISTTEKSDIGFVNICTYIGKNCPELKESEDERVRQDIIETIKKEAKEFPSSVIASKCKIWLEWLEKQGEQKPADVDNKFIRMRETKPKDISEFLDRLTTVEQEFLWEHIAKIRELDKEEQKPTETTDLRTWKYIVDAVLTEREGIGQYLDSPLTEEVAKKLQKRFGNIEQILINSAKTCNVEQKPEWSEEDNDMLLDIDACIVKLPIFFEKIEVNGKDVLTSDFISKARKFLKSLKDRVQPQPKQEWSKDDITRIDEIIETLNIVQANRVRTQRMHYNKATIDKNIDWLKSLRSQSHWKPSEEQIAKDVAEKFARVIRGNLSIVDERVQNEIERVYREVTGEKMYGHFID